MTHAIEINDSSKNVLTVTLTDLLEKIASSGCRLNWTILYVYATGNLGNEKSMLNFEDEVNNSKDGMLISWQELILLAPKFDQIYDILIIGCDDLRALKKYDDEKEMYEKCDLVLDLFDSSYWQIFAKNEIVIDTIKNSFNDTKMIEV